MLAELGGGLTMTGLQWTFRFQDLNFQNLTVFCKHAMIESSHSRIKLKRNFVTKLSMTIIRITVFGLKNKIFRFSVLFPWLLKKSFKILFFLDNFKCCSNWWSQAHTRNLPVITFQQPSKVEMIKHLLFSLATLQARDGLSKVLPVLSLPLIKGEFPWGFRKLNRKTLKEINMSSFHCWNDWTHFRVMKRFSRMENLKN